MTPKQEQAVDRLRRQASKLGGWGIGDDIVLSRLTRMDWNPITEMPVRIEIERVFIDPEGEITNKQRMTYIPEVELCVMCNRPAEGNYSIHEDPAEMFDNGPEVPLCDACGSGPTPTCETIWEFLRQKKNMEVIRQGTKENGDVDVEGA